MLSQTHSFLQHHLEPEVFKSSSTKDFTVVETSVGEEQHNIISHVGVQFRDGYPQISTGIW